MCWKLHFSSIFSIRMNSRFSGPSNMYTLLKGNLLSDQSFQQKYSHKIICAFKLFYVSYVPFKGSPCLDIKNLDTSAGCFHLGLLVSSPSCHSRDPLQFYPTLLPWQLHKRLYWLVNFFLASLDNLASANKTHLGSSGMTCEIPC